MIEKRAFMDLTLAMAIVGSSVAAGAHVVAHLPMHFAMTVRFIAACALLTPWCVFREGRLPRLSLKQWLLVFLQALCGGFLFNVLLLEGLKHTDPGSAGIVASTTPACMALFSWLLLKERPSMRTWLGLGLCVAGLVALRAWDLAGGGDGSEKSASLFGMVLVLGAVVSESMFLLLRKTLPEELSSLAASTVVSLAGLAIFMPLGVWQLGEVEVAAITPLTWLVLLYYGLGISAAAYLLWFRGVVRVPGSVAAVFTGVLPVSGLATSAVFLGAPLTLAHVLGCGLVLAAIVSLSGVRLDFAKRFRNIILLKHPGR